MKTIRNALMLGACTLLPAAAIAQTTPAATGTPAAAPSQPTTAPATTPAAATTSTTAAPAASTPAGSAPAGGASSAASTGATSTASLAAGAKVLDTSGGTAGTIESVDGDFVVLATTKSKVRLPKTSFAMGPNGPVIAMTAAQIDAAAAQATPAAAASSGTAKPNVVSGAAVADTKGGSVGTVSGVEGSTATVTLTGGSKVRLPVTAFAAGSGGGLVVAMSAAQLKAAASAK